MTVIFRNHKNGVTLCGFLGAMLRPCMMQGPIIEKVAEQIGDKAKIAKMNVDEGVNSANAFGINSIDPDFV